ncbi:hypothetical protein [Streptomyces sp. NPDC005078]|uniref:LexA family protein n=1 Tax=unclassified Streptomyces TaxID=2593676 RepID=UPI00339DB092
MSAERLTARQESVLRVIRDAIADTGEAPTIRENRPPCRAVQYWLGRLPARPPGEPRPDQPQRTPLALLQARPVATRSRHPRRPGPTLAAPSARMRMPLRFAITAADTAH